MEQTRIQKFKFILDFQFDIRKKKVSTYIFFGGTKSLDTYVIKFKFSESWFTQLYYNFQLVTYRGN